MLRKILIILFYVFIIGHYTPVLATNYFWDASCATPGDGTVGDCDGDADDAFDNVSDFESVASAGDVLWMRRDQTEQFAADLILSADGQINLPIYFVGWPRASKQINCDWTNGSTTVDNVDSNDMDREQHVARFVTAPDGFDYLITYITDSNTFIIDRPYAGSTSSDENVTIKADVLPAGVTQPSDPNNWNSDSDELPTLDGQSNDITIDVRQEPERNFYFLNIKEFSDATYGNFYFNTVNNSVVHGCLVKQSADEVVFSNVGYTNLVIDQCVFEGSGSGNSQVGMSSTGFSNIYIKNSAIYNCGDYGFSNVSSGNVYMENLNIGVEVANQDDDINWWIGDIVGRDVKLGGTNGEVSVHNSYTGSPRYPVIINNYNKTLGNYKSFLKDLSVIEKVAVTDTNANKKLSDNVIEITPPTTNGTITPQIELKNLVFESRKTYDAGTYNVKVWIYNDTGNVLNDTTATDDILMRCRPEAGSYGDATTEYVSMPWLYSTEIDIADAANADDWDYLQVSSIPVGVSGSKIYCEILASFYDAEANVILIDPVMVNP